MSTWNLFSMCRDFLNNNEATVDWCVEKGLVRGKERNCGRCKRRMYWDNSFPFEKFGRLRCRNRRCSNFDKLVSLTKGSLFADCHILPQMAIVLMYSFARQMSYVMAI